MRAGRQAWGGAGCTYGAPPGAARSARSTGAARPWSPCCSGRTLCRRHRTHPRCPLWTGLALLCCVVVVLACRDVNTCGRSPQRLREAWSFCHPWRQHSGQGQWLGSTTGKWGLSPPPSNRHSGGCASTPWLDGNAASTLHRLNESTKTRDLVRMPATKNGDCRLDTTRVQPQEKPSNSQSTNLFTVYLLNTSSSLGCLGAKEDIRPVHAHECTLVLKYLLHTRLALNN